MTESSPEITRGGPTVKGSRVSRANRFNSYRKRS